MIILVVLKTSFLEAQNLVLNAGLENYSSCPGFGQFGNTWINDWDKPSWGSSDYYHINCPGIIPVIGSMPHSGNAEAGIILYNYGQEYREYITATLSQPLIAGKKYDVWFYLALNPGYIQAIQEAGAYLSDSLPGPFPNSLTIIVAPQVKNVNGFISYGWNKISGIYVAAGGEKHITIGNFSNDSNTTTSMVGTMGSYGAYYFVDDVYVAAADSIPPTYIEDIHREKPVIFPNPVRSSDEISISYPFTENASIFIYDAKGILKNIYEMSKSNQTIKFSAYPAGLYFYFLKSKESIISKGKLVIEQ